MPSVAGQQIFGSAVFTIPPRRLSSRQRVRDTVWLGIDPIAPVSRYASTLTEPNRYTGRLRKPARVEDLRRTAMSAAVNHPAPPVASRKGSGSPSKTRTCDKSVNSRLLYQLSYRGSWVKGNPGGGGVKLGGGLPGAGVGGGDVVGWEGVEVEVGDPVAGGAGRGAG